MTDAILMTIDQAAEALAMTPRYLAENYRRLGIPHVKTGHRTLRFSRVGIEAWVKRVAQP